MYEETNRTVKVTRNVITLTACQVITLLINFINRTIFIKVLGVEYLGINGLFTNILTLLSFTELGLGSAITFHLYKPLAEKKEEELKQLMKLYSSVYKGIGIIVLLIGVILIPFLPSIIGQAPDIKENINLIYILFLLNSSISYFFVYKSTIITADQKEYIVSINRQIITIISTIIGFCILYITHNYIIYIVWQIMTTLIINIRISIKANKMYPFIKNTKNSKIEKNKLKEIVKDAKALLMYKGASVVLDGTDNIIISSLLGVGTVGYTSNYTMIINSVSSLVRQVINSCTASVGNLNVTSDAKHSKEVFYKLFFMSFWIYSLGSLMLLTLANDFIQVWLGSEFILESLVLVGLVFSFYIQGVQLIPYIYRTTLGLFVQGKYAPILAAIINIILSIVLGKIYGAGGIFIATGISRFLTIGIVDPILVFKKKFESNVREYFKKFFTYSAFLCIMYLLIRFVTTCFIINNFFMLIIKATVVFILYNFVFYIVFHKKEEFKGVLQIIKSILSKIFKKRS